MSKLNLYIEGAPDQGRIYFKCSDMDAQQARIIDIVFNEMFGIGERTSGGSATEFSSNFFSGDEAREFFNAALPRIECENAAQIRLQVETAIKQFTSGKSAHKA